MTAVSSDTPLLDETRSPRLFVLLGTANQAEGSTMPSPIPNEQNVNNLIPSLTNLTLRQPDSLPAAPWESADMDAKVRFESGDESHVDALFPRGLNGPSRGVGGLCTELVLYFVARQTSMESILG